MRPPSPRRPGGKREQPSDAAGDEPDVGEATPASSQRRARGRVGRSATLVREPNAALGKVLLSAGLVSAEARRVPGRRRASVEPVRVLSAPPASRARNDTRAPSSAARHAVCSRTPVAAADAATLLGSEEATDLGDRLRERTRARRMLLLRRIAVSVVTVALVVGAGWLAFFSPLFALSTGNIQVTGEDGRLVTVDSVRSSVSPFEGVPLTRLDTQAVSRAVQENVAVKSASVSRRWPTSLKVSVTMRAGIAVEAAEGTYWLVDDQGVRFERVSSVGGYPLVTLLWGSRRRSL